MSGPPAAHVQENEPEGTPDGGIGAEAGPEEAGARVHADGGGERAADDDERSHRMGGRLDAVEIEGGLEHGLHRGHDHGEVGGLAACHDRVDRELLDARLAPEGRHEAEDTLRVLADARDHRPHPLGGRGHDGQPVAPVSLDELRVHVVFGHL